MERVSSRLTFPVGIQGANVRWQSNNHDGTLQAALLQATSELRLPPRTPREACRLRSTPPGAVQHAPAITLSVLLQVAPALPLNPPFRRRPHAHRCCPPARRRPAPLPALPARSGPAPGRLLPRGALRLALSSGPAAGPPQPAGARSEARFLHCARCLGMSTISARLPPSRALSQALAYTVQRSGWLGSTPAACLLVRAGKACCLLPAAESTRGTGSSSIPRGRVWCSPSRGPAGSARARHAAAAGR